MKAGDTVVITDGSWTRSIINGELVEESLGCGENKGRHYTVVEPDCSFPLITMAFLPYQPNEYRNDTVIQDENGKVVLIHHGFLNVVKTEHVWKHGDIMVEQDGSYPKMYVSLTGEEPRVIHLLQTSYNDKGMVANGRVHEYLTTNPVFLFNIKDTL